MGHNLFINDLTQHVFHLKINYRSKDNPEVAKILAKLRIGNLDDVGGDGLMNQRIENQEDNLQEYLHNHKKTIHLYTQRYETNIKNMEMLV